MIRVVAVLFVVLGLSVTSCAVGCACSQPVYPVTIFGAASLGTALEQIKTTYKQGRADVEITLSTGSSAALRTQIEQGAPADLFLSADTANPQALVDAGLTDGGVLPFATNRLTIVVPNGNSAGITSAVDLARPGVRIIAAEANVPVTRYAAQVIGELAALSANPAEFVAAYESNVSSREENVGAVVSKIKLGEGDAAIVYVTDARAAQLQTIDIPAEADVVAAYGGVVLRRATSVATAHDVLNWIKGPAGQAILGNLGFSPAP